MRAGVAGIQDWGAERRSCRTTLVVRAGTMGHAGRAVLTNGRRYSHAPVEHRAAAGPEGNTAYGCESLISKWH